MSTSLGICSCFKVSLNDLVIKAAATALQHVPEMNLNVQGEDFQVTISLSCY